MTRISYILFGLMVVGLTISIVLYQQSRENSELFLARTNVVKEVLFLLERTEKLKNILRKTVYNRSNDVDTAFVFTMREKTVIDSILQRLHQIVLYDDQRGRIDTIQALINHNFALTLRPPPNSEQYRVVTDVLARAHRYAEGRLRQQQQMYNEYQQKVSLWVNAILTSSFCLFVVGVLSTVAERRSKSRLKYLHESILTSSSNGVCVFEMIRNDPGRPKLVFSNVGAIVHMDSGEESIVSLSDSVFENHVLSESINLVFKSGKTIIRELEHKAGEKTFWFIISIIRIAERNVVFNYQDITPLKQYEIELQARVAELQAVNKDLEQFAHATSHDLKEPFRKIQMMGDLVLKGSNATNHTKYLEAMVKAANKGSQLVEQILNYSKVQFNKSELSAVDLKQVVINVMEDLELTILEKNASVEIDPLPIIKGNKVQMTQLFLNLLGNALKFSATDKKPLIRITCFEIAGSDVPALNPRLSYYAISIRDNGIGFDQMYSQKIFEAFERLNNYQSYSGFGLGLSLCKRIVLNHDGAIRAASKLGEGSTFTVYLPKNA